MTGTGTVDEAAAALYIIGLAMQIDTWLLHSTQYRLCLSIVEHSEQIGYEFSDPQHVFVISLNENSML